MGAGISPGHLRSFLRYLGNQRNFLGPFASRLGSSELYVVAYVVGPGFAFAAGMARRHVVDKSARVGIALLLVPSTQKARVTTSCMASSEIVEEC